MIDLSTQYAGLNLKNPIILGSSKLTAHLDRIKMAEQAGVAAIVAASLFEEQINLQNLLDKKKMEQFTNIDHEISNLFPESSGEAGPEEHLFWLRKTKEEVKIPVIASLNAINAETWIDYALKMEQTGVDALELNFFHIPSDYDKTAAEVEAGQIAIIKEIVAKVKIPVTVKLSYFYSNTLNFIKQVSETGVAGVVLFNRLFQPDVDINKEQHVSPFKLSNGTEKGLALRYAGLLYNNIKPSIASNTGFYFGEDVIKAILMGADAVQLVSTFIVNNLVFNKTILSDISSWMEEHEYAKIDDFRGKLSKANTPDLLTYKRAQYVDLLFNSEKIILGAY